MKREFSWNDIQELLDGENPIKTTSWKYGHTDHYVFSFEDKHWLVSIQVHNTDGWQKVDPIEAKSVIRVAKVQYVWEPE